QTPRPRQGTVSTDLLDVELQCGTLPCSSPDAIAAPFRAGVHYTVAGSTVRHELICACNRSYSRFRPITTSLLARSALPQSSPARSSKSLCTTCSTYCRESSRTAIIP